MLNVSMTLRGNHRYGFYFKTLTPNLSRLGEQNRQSECKSPETHEHDKTLSGSDGAIGVQRGEQREIKSVLVNHIEKKSF